MGIHGLCEEPREAGLAGAGWAPEQDRGEMAAVRTLPQRSALADEMFLADELVERSRAHSRGEWLRSRRRLEEAVRLRTGNAATGHGGDGTRAGRVRRRCARPTFILRAWTAGARSSSRSGS